MNGECWLISALLVPASGCSILFEADTKPMEGCPGNVLPFDGAFEEFVFSMDQISSNRVASLEVGVGMDGGAGLLITTDPTGAAFIGADLTTNQAAYAVSLDVDCLERETAPLGLQLQSYSQVGAATEEDLKAVVLPCDDWTTVRAALEVTETTDPMATAGFELRIGLPSGRGFVFDNMCVL